MNGAAGLAMFALQTADIRDFGWDEEGLAIRAVIFAIGVTVIVVSLVVATALKKRGKVKAFSEGYVPQWTPYSGRGVYFSLLRLSRDMGLDREKSRMLRFVMKSGGVTDVSKVLESPELIDRHFRRAYNHIEDTSASEEDLNKRLSVLFATRNILETYTATVSISSTRQIKENTEATLLVGNAGDNYPTKIVSNKADELAVEHPLDGKGSPVSVAAGSVVNIAFFTKSNKAFSVQSRVLDTGTTAGRQVLRLAHSGKIKKLSSRRFRRRQTRISAAFYLVKVESSGPRKKKTLLVSKMQLHGDILDISIGGCSISTEVAAKAGQTIKIEFSGENASVAALGEVLRTNRTGRNTVMHVKFLKIPRKSLNYISAMVYQYANA